MLSHGLHLRSMLIHYQKLCQHFLDLHCLE